jgi:hypothetical protein
MEASPRIKTLHPKVGCRKLPLRLNVLQPSAAIFQQLWFKNATAQQVGGSFGKILGSLAALSKDGGPDETEVEA